MLLQEVENALTTGENVDAFAISDLVDKMDMGFSHRIELTNKNLSEYENRIGSKKQAEREEREIREKEQKEAEEKTSAEDETEVSETFPPEIKTGSTDDIEDETSVPHATQVYIKKDELDTETLSKLYSYINILGQKFEKQHPEVSYDGEYIADKQWKVELSKRSVRGSIKEGRFKTPMLIVDNYWKSIDDKRDIIEMIQAKASTIEQNQYMSLCFISSSWDQSIKDWARTYSHQRLGFFIYDLAENNLVYNETDENNRKFAFWHSTNRNRTKLTQIVDQLIEDEEYFDLNDVMEHSGLNLRGAKKFIDGLIKKKALIDVGLDSPKYTRSK
jgi:predicted transcriptional regulator